MAITSMDQDLFSNEMYGLPCALNYYYYNTNIPNKGANDSDYFTVCPAIQSIQFVPFIDTKDLDLFKVPYDSARFGNNGVQYDVGDCSVYRISDFKGSATKKIGSFKCYKPTKTIGGKFNWENESRLYNYPYSFAMLTDNLNTPIEIKYHLCKHNDNDIKVINTISNKCSYGLFVENYKGDTTGSLEALVSGDGHELPCSSASYNQWFASNKNQQAQNLNHVTNKAFISNATAITQGGAGVVTAGAQMLTGGFAGIGQGIGTLANTAINVGSSLANTSEDKQHAIKSALAQKQDLNNTPNTMLSMGSDVYYGLQKGNYEVNLYRFGIQETQYERIGQYFNMFGYKQNRVVKPNIRNRHYFNYIKTIDANLNSYRMPREYLAKLKSIFDNGVTIWHIDRKGVVVGDYSNDNYEV